MSRGGDDDEYSVGRGRPPKHTQFKKGTSGNPNGRPTKPRAALLPSQLRKDILKVMELPLSVKMHDGEKTLTLREAAIYSLAKRAIAGEKVSYMKLWLQMQREAVEEHVAAHPELLNIELFEALIRDQPPHLRDEAYVKSLKALIRKSKGL